MFAAQGLLARIPERLGVLRLGIPFALAGAAAFAWPELMCGGDAIVELLRSPAFPSLAALVTLLVGKYVFTAVCFGSGAPGGTLFPLVVLGGLVGAATAVVAQGLGPARRVLPQLRRARRGGALLGRGEGAGDRRRPGL